jgi:hypothetical protein
MMQLRLSESMYKPGAQIQVYRSLLVGLLLCIVDLVHAQAVAAPALQCASVNVAGDVTVTWQPPADPGNEFVQYEIFYSTDAAGPFVQIAVEPVLAQTTFFHAGANANAGARYYYMTAISSGPPPSTSAPSDTLATLYLQVFQSTPLGNANLSWNAPATASTALDEFSVWMEYPLGTWTMLNEVSTTTFNYQHEISICNDTLNFRIGLADASGCISFSNAIGDRFEDATPPTSPVMTAVTVDSTSGLSTLNWTASPEGDTDGYIIVLVTPGGGVIIDTIYGQNNTTYTWPPSTAGLAPESFTIAAFDTCQVGIPPSPNTSATRPPHTTMYASTLYDRCAASVTVRWTPYVGWPVQSYQVLVQVDGGPWGTLANVDPNDVQLVRTVEPDRTYCFLVKAIQAPGGVYSLSNRTCRTSTYPPLPTYNYLSTVTVTGEEQITVIDVIDPAAEISAFRIERSDNGAPFETLALVPGGGGAVLNYVDEPVEPDDIGYRYRVMVLDSCGADALESNVGGNIVLRASSRLDGFNVLEWNGYAEWAGLVQGYVVSRSVDGSPFDPIAVLPEFPWTFEDDVQGLVASSGKACYMVQALESGNPGGANATSESNVACTVQQDLVYIPNAFIVGGANPVFQPILSFVDVSDYQLVIINRWGQEIWRTSDPGKPWDGRVDGQLLPIGVYGYYCAFNNGAGKRFEKRGTVTLLTAYE